MTEAVCFRNLHFWCWLCTVTT